MSTTDTREPPGYEPDRDHRRLPGRRLRDAGSSWIRRIVVAADGSPSSTQGLRQVADLAPRLGAIVIVVYVRQLPAPALLYPGIDPGLVEALEEQETAVRQEALRLVGGTGVAWKLVIRVGSPGDEIVRVAEESDADLVVLGGNRHSSIRNLLLGSTAAYVCRYAFTSSGIGDAITSGELVQGPRRGRADPVSVWMALFPPSHTAFERREMAESSPMGSARRRPIVRGVPHGGQQQ